MLRRAAGCGSIRIARVFICSTCEQIWRLYSGQLSHPSYVIVCPVGKNNLQKKKSAMLPQAIDVFCECTRNDCLCYELTLRRYGTCGRFGGLQALRCVR